MATDPVHRVLDAILRNDLAAFSEKTFERVAPGQHLHRSWHMHAIAYQLERCRLGENRRLIITLPPRHMKSIMASVAFPAFLLGHDPTARVFCASHSADLAAKHARDCRAVMLTEWYRRVFPGTRLGAERNAEMEFLTTRRGFRLSTSVGGSLTGRGGNFIIVDDAMKAEDAFSQAKRSSTNEWFDNTLFTRLDNKSTDVIIVIMQRLHIDDLVGHLLAADDSWEHLDLPAIAEVDAMIPLGRGRFYQRRTGDLLSLKREPLATLDEIRRTLGSFNFSAQYQQRPIPAEGEIIKWGWFGRYEVPPKGHVTFQSWDTAQKDGQINDYSVCTTWSMKDGKFYLLDIYRAKLLYPELRRAVSEKRAQWKAGTVLIEDRGAGTSLIQELQYRLGATVIPIEPIGDKALRASQASIPIEGGRVLLPQWAPWLDAFQKEILQFPEGQHDDQVDSMAHFLGWIQQRLSGHNTVRMVPISGI